ncbi:hypothetical protein GCM10028798_29600 [Humibacter antri]
MSGQLVEIRRYVAHPGRRGALADYMDRVVIPFVRAHGVQVTASLVDQNDADAYIWIRSFQDEDDRVEKYRMIYQDPEWVGDIEPVVRELMDFERAVIATATPTVAIA